ncbi:MAG: hypothetical protein SynsKO_21110 [Synoicihabitans sp.]
MNSALLRLPLLLLVTSGFMGCSSTSPLTIEKHGAPIASSIGADLTELEYISSGDFAPLEELSTGFNLGTKGMVALARSSIYWRSGQGDSAGSNNFREISLSSIEGAALDQGVLHLRIDQKFHVLRLTEWNPFQASPRKTEQFLQILRDRKIPEVAVEESIVDYPLNRLSPFSERRPNHIASPVNPLMRD